MSTILSMLKRFEAVNAEEIIIATMEESKDTLADLNAQQINSGIRSDGTSMPDYSLRSVIQYGKPVGPIRLRDTGAWQAGIYARIVGDSVQFGSSDSKDKMLVEKYGPEIEGLSEKYRNEAMEEKIRPVFKEKIFEATKLLMK